MTAATPRFDTRPATIAGRDMRVTRALGADDAPMTWGALAAALRLHPEARAALNDSLSAHPWDFQWKPVPYHAATHDAPWFAVAAPSRFAPANPSAYREHLDALPEGVWAATFANLSGRSTLIAPRDVAPFGHIAQFCRDAPHAVVDALWSATAEELCRRIGQGAPFWCNTHGHGVPWFHMRFDPSQKYTAFPPRGPITEASQRAWYKSIYHACFDAP